MLTEYFKKEHLLIVVALLCIVIYYYRDKVNAKKTTEWLPIIGGLAFGLNTLITIAKN